jgi:transposase
MKTEVKKMGRRIFSKEYKLQTTRQVIEDGKRVNEVSESLGITEQTIYRWLREYDKYGKEAFKGFGNVRVDSRYKIKLLEKKNKQLEKENEILKKFRVFQKGRQDKK